MKVNKYNRNPIIVYPNNEKLKYAKTSATKKARNLPIAVFNVSFLVGCIVRIVTIPADTGNSIFKN